jgi:hypothetical protein
MDFTLKKAPESFICDKCDFTCSKESGWIRHISTSKHKKRAKVIFTPDIIHSVLTCDECDFQCCKESDWKRHIMTNKHKKRQEMKIPEMKEDVCDFACDNCNNIYNSNSSLLCHRQKCVNQDKKLEEPSLASMFLEMMKQNEEFKQLLIEQNKQNQELQKQVVEIASNQSTTNNINYNNNNTTNNKFNLTLFLNETCKDAMNIQEFIDYVTVQHSDFENFGKMGYVEALTRIFLRNLMELEVHRRPIHCSDLKREVLYVKDNDVWVSDISREKLIRTIKYIANKNVKQIPGWMDKNPDSKNTQTKLHDKYMRMLCFSMGAKTEEEDQEYYKKIIRNVAKEVCIDKAR